MKGGTSALYMSVSGNRGGLSETIQIDTRLHRHIVLISQSAVNALAVVYCTLDEKFATHCKVPPRAHLLPDFWPRKDLRLWVSLSPPLLQGPC